MRENEKAPGWQSGSRNENCAQLDNPPLGTPEATFYVALENVDAFLDGLCAQARPLQEARLVNGGDA